ncbi:uncharacterized protein YuzB (UPF0349 family) [Bacillus fengqiuensis]|nr:uncharacterized protein YuzB (UPF0349 family) [Bacillus fengqiuensis]
MMELTVKFCPCNFEDDLYEVKERLAQTPNIEVIEERCLLYCGQCLVQPFALVNGKNVISDTADELFENIIDHIEELNAEGLQSSINIDGPVASGK